MSAGHQIPFFLVTGFLGAGKTSLLKHFLETHAARRRLAVVQNEFAPGNVDAPDLRRTGKTFHILEINRGSVFCVCLLADFKQSLAALVDDCRPAAVVLEASGLADPIALAQILEAPELKARLVLTHVWCVVDTSRFLTLERSLRGMVHQVRIADTILLNKTDQATSAQADAVKARVRQLNPLARCVPTLHSRVALEDAFAPLAHPPVARRLAGAHAKLEPCGRPAMEAMAFRSADCLSQAGLDAFLQQVVPQTVRLKGFFARAAGEALAVQACFGDWQVAPAADYQGPTEFVAMGPDLKPDRVRALYAALAQAGKRAAFSPGA